MGSRRVAREHPRGIRSLLVLAAALTALSGAGEAAAATWVDPDIDSLVQLSELIAVVEATGEVGAAGPHTAKVKVVKAVCGEAPARELALTGHFDPERQDPPTLPAGQRFVAFLEKRDGAWAAMTPSFGLFPIRDERVRGSCRDTSTRAKMTLSRWLDFVTAVKEEVAPAALLKRWRGLVDGAGLVALDEDKAAQLHLALEGLARFGGAEDRERAKRMLGSELYEVRASACRLLAIAGGDEALALLAERVRSDSEETVRCWAAWAVTRLDPMPASAVTRARELAAEASAEGVRLHTGVMDPRRNALPAPKVVLLRFLGEKGDREALPQFDAAMRSADPELIKAGIAATLALADKDLIPTIIACMRGSDARDVAYNQIFAAALSQALGASPGVTRADWERWWSAQSKGRGPDGSSGRR